MLWKNFSSVLIGVFIPVCVWLLVLVGTCPAAGANDVPAAYAGLYYDLKQVLEGELAGLKMLDKLRVERMPLISADLLVANANRGPALLQPDTLATLRLSLDRFQEIGIRSVKFALHYPLLRPDFPHAADYLAFYRQVVKEAHARGIKVMPHVTVLFNDTPFSPFKGLYRELDLERFKREYRDMVHLIVRELQPDFLALLTEPDTHAKLTGLRELNDPPTVVDIIRYTLQGLDRGNTLIGAGSGSWSPTTFAKGLAEQTDLNFICIHIYPITGPFISNAKDMVEIAHANGKKAFVDEAWLYKTLKPGQVNNIAASADVFRLDSYSFWQPLDKKFMNLMLRLAETEQIELVSFFWSSHFFGYLDYLPELEQLPYRELNQRLNRIVYTNMLDGRLSDVGKFIRREIAAGRMIENDK